MEIIAWYFLVIEVLNLVSSPINVGKERTPRTEGSAALGVILNLPLLYLAYQLVFGGIL